MKDVIDKVADAIKSFGQLIAENIRTSSKIIIAKKASISPIETYQILLDLAFQTPFLHNIYTKLIMNVDLLNLVFGYPYRKNFILSGALGGLNKFNMEWFYVRICYICGILNMHSHVSVKHFKH